MGCQASVGDCECLDFGLVKTKPLDQGSSKVPTFRSEDKKSDFSIRASKGSTIMHNKQVNLNDG